MKLKAGHTVTETRIFTQADFDTFARLSGDDNPIHVAPVFAANTKFGRTVAHGMMLYGMICGVVSRHFPGAVQMEQQLMFPAPTYADEEVTIKVEITEIMAHDHFRLKTTIRNSRGEPTCQGDMVMIWIVDEKKIA